MFYYVPISYFPRIYNTHVDHVKCLLTCIQNELVVYNAGYFEIFFFLSGGRTVQDCDLHQVILVRLSTCLRIFCQSAQADTSMTIQGNPRSRSSN